MNYIQTYQERQQVKFKLKSIRQKARPEEYQSLKQKEHDLTEKLNEIIRQEKNANK